LKKGADMKGDTPIYKTIDEYIATCTEEVQPILQELRKIIKAAAPDAEEKISYKMPAFFQNGPLVYFAPMKNHIGFYPTGIGVEAFKDELLGYVTTKGSIHLPMDKPLPKELIQRIVKYKVIENLKKAELNSGKRK
jgi:uncharacterized protein YdhG (YjbR/CyaY superfamily)